jgi:hypothetical protein
MLLTVVDRRYMTSLIWGLDMSLLGFVICLEN